jgi:hypothetical protein
VISERRDLRSWRFAFVAAVESGHRRFAERSRWVRSCDGTTVACASIAVISEQRDLQATRSPSDAISERRDLQAT